MKGGERIMSSIENKVNKRKSIYDILARVINKCRTGAKQTHIIYDLNTCWVHGTKIIRLCMEKELIDKTGDFYLPTEKGLEYEKRYGHLVMLL